MSASFIIAAGGNGTFRLTTFEGVPTVAPCLVVIVPPSDAADPATLLEKELATVLGSSGPNITMTETTEHAADPSLLEAFQEPARQKLLVLLCGALPLKDRPWFAAWLEHNVLTVFKAGANPSDLLPTRELRALNAQFWNVSVTESVPAILARAGLTFDDQRIFISYRRLEAQPLAEQLFDALTHEGFDVFLDRFSIPTGFNFQQRLTQELTDKSMVLLIESQWVHTSEWTDHEVQFAKRYQLGLLALQMPDRPEPLGSIHADYRMNLRRGHFTGDPEPKDNPEFATKGKQPARYPQWGPLTEEKLKEVVARAKTTHDAAIFRRRIDMRANINEKLRQAGLTPQPVGADGLMMVDAAHRYALWLTTRPPELSDFRYTHAKVTPPPGAKGIIIGPTAALEPGRKDRLDWLSERCSFRCIDQDDVPEAALRMLKGSL